MDECLAPLSSGSVDFKVYTEARTHKVRKEGTCQRLFMGMIWDGFRVQGLVIWATCRDLRNIGVCVCEDTALGFYLGPCCT